VDCTQKHGMHANTPLAPAPSHCPDRSRAQHSGAADSTSQHPSGVAAPLPHQARGSTDSPHCTVSCTCSQKRAPPSCANLHCGGWQHTQHPDQHSTILLQYMQPALGACLLPAYSLDHASVSCNCRCCNYGFGYGLPRHAGLVLDGRASEKTNNKAKAGGARADSTHKYQVCRCPCRLQGGPCQVLQLPALRLAQDLKTRIA
jgi:hypothetical protein